MGRELLPVFNTVLLVIALIVSMGWIQNSSSFYGIYPTTWLALTLAVCAFYTWKNEGFFPHGGIVKLVRHLAFIGTAVLVVVLEAAHYFPQVAIPQISWGLVGTIAGIGILASGIEVARK